MAYNEILANRIRESLQHIQDVVEKEMMGGLTFMVNGKMCVGIIQDEMMCRIAPELHESSIEKPGCRTMDFTKKPMKGYVMIDEQGMKKKSDFNYWISLSLSYNSIAKASPKKSKKTIKKTLK